MGDRPAVAPQHPGQHLPLARFAVARVAVPRQPVALEIRRGQIVENHLGAQRKQIVQPEEQLLFDRRLVRGQSVEGAIPAVELGVLNAHRERRLRRRSSSSRQAGSQRRPRRSQTNSVFQPARQPVLARGRAQAVGGQHQHAIGQPRLPARGGGALEAVENVFQAELLEGLAQGQKTPPSGGLFGSGKLVGVDPAAGRSSSRTRVSSWALSWSLRPRLTTTRWRVRPRSSRAGLDELDVFVDFGRGAEDAGEARKHGRNVPSLL